MAKHLEIELRQLQAEARVMSRQGGKVFTQAQSLATNLLTAVEAYGHFVLRPRNHIKMKGLARIRVKYAVGQAIRISLKPGDNNTAWDYDLVPPTGVDADELCKRLLQYLSGNPAHESHLERGEREAHAKLIARITEMGGRVSARDIRSMFKNDSESAEAALHDLVCTDLGRWETVMDTGGRPRRDFILFTQAEREKAEEAEEIPVTETIEIAPTLPAETVISKPPKTLLQRVSELETHRQRIGERRERLAAIDVKRAALQSQLRMLDDESMQILKEDEEDHEAHESNEILQNLERLFARG